MTLPPVDAGSSLAIAVIGSGISGMAAAKVLQQLGHVVTIYERAPRIGGVWLTTYPGVRLQNVAQHYRFSDFGWPFPVDEHPTGEQVLRYLDAAVSHYDLDVRVSHEVTALTRDGDGWRLAITSPGGPIVARADRVVVAVGMFSGDKPDFSLPGQSDFAGRILTERDLRASPDALADGRVAVIGFGKTAVDLATFAAEAGARVEHVFRAPRWLLPRRLLGRGIGDVAAARSSAAWTPAWVHPDRGEAFLHRWMPWSVQSYWKTTEWLFRLVQGLHPFHRTAARARLRLVTPDQPLTYQMRAAAALAPDNYFRLVREGAITPHRGSVARLTEDGLLLGSGELVRADTVLLAVGYDQPQFPFLPEEDRLRMTGTPGGVQLYRHVIHPLIPGIAFAGFNHCFLHVTGVEIAMLWYGAVLEGRLCLPEPDAMSASAARVAAWKQANTLFEPTRAYGIGGRFHQYFDVMLAELGINSRRKHNFVKDELSPYWAADYAGLEAEYRAQMGGSARPSLPYDT